MRVADRAAWEVYRVELKTLVLSDYEGVVRYGVVCQRHTTYKRSTVFCLNAMVKGVIDQHGTRGGKRIKVAALGYAQVSASA